MNPLNQTATALPEQPSARGVTLDQLSVGDTGRIIRLSLPDHGCRKRFAEMGLAEGCKVTVVGGGDTLLLAIGASRMALAQRCAQYVTVLKLPA